MAGVRRRDLRLSYAGGGADVIPTAVETIALELSARFCADALAESYFGWNRQRFASACEHNLLRAQSQLTLAQSIGRQRGEMKRVVEQACATGVLSPT